MQERASKRKREREVSKRDRTTRLADGKSQVGSVHNKVLMIHTLLHCIATSFAFHQQQKDEKKEVFGPILPPKTRRLHDAYTSRYFDSTM